jgi:phage terminase Nu1 subunit (DNA packaging protein)
MQWTINKAACEFGLSRETLRKRLTLAELDTKSTYTTKEICRAVFGDINSERLRLTREQADKLALDNEQSRRSLVPVQELIPMLGKFLSAARARIDGDPKLEREEKDKIIEDLGKCLDVAHGLTQGTAPAVDAAS